MTKGLHDNSDRMLAAFNRLALFGATGDGGVTRATFSEAVLAARNWCRDEIGTSGLEFRTDGAANHSAVLPSHVLARERSDRSNLPHDQPIASQQSLAMTPTLLLGSHLDSVPNG